MSIHTGDVLTTSLAPTLVLLSLVLVKLVSQILTGKFIELYKLPFSNIVSAEHIPQLLFEGILVWKRGLSKFDVEVVYCNVPVHPSERSMQT